MGQANEAQRPWMAKMEAARQRVALACGRAQSALFPFDLLENCDSRDRQATRKAWESNRRNRGVILPYLGAWALRSGSMAAGLSVSANAQAAGIETTGLQAAFAVAFSLCVVACVVLGVGWAMLGRQDA